MGLDDDGIAAAFLRGQTISELVASYLSELRTNWRETEKSITRTAALIVASATAFLLFALGRAKEVSVAGLKVSDVDVLVAALPIVLAYLYYQLTKLFVESQMFSNVHESLVRQAWGSLYENDLQRLLHPPDSIVQAVDLLYYGLSRPRIANLTQVTGGARVVVLLLAPPAFEVYAYVEMARRFGLASPLFWIAVLLSAILLACSVVHIAALKTVAK